MLTEADLRDRLATADLQTCLAGPPPEKETAPPSGLIPAAVLVGIATGPAPGVLLTRRTAHLRRHSGQVAFPGGRIDPDDASPEHAALREAFEEVGLEPGHVEIVGRLPDHVTGTGFLVTPVLALLRPGFVAQPSPHEVAAVFHLPMAVLLDPDAPQRRRALHEGVWREYWVWPHPDQDIWGATAAILVALAARLQPAHRT